MPECPKCKEEIDTLKEWQSGEMAYYFDGERYDQLDFEADDEVNDYECPECCAVLFTDEDAAREFLKPTNQKKRSSKKKKE